MGCDSIYVSQREKGAGLDTQKINKENGALNIFLWQDRAAASTRLRCWRRRNEEADFSLACQRLYLVFKMKLQIINSLLLFGEEKNGAEGDYS